MLAVAPTNALVWAKLAQSLDDAAGWDLQRGTAIQLYERACFLYPYNGDVSRLAVEAIGADIRKSGWKAVPMMLRSAC